MSKRFIDLRDRNNGGYHIGVPIVLWMFDSDGRFSLIEGEGLSVLGITPRELLGKSIINETLAVPLTSENVRLALGGTQAEDFVEFDDLVLKKPSN